MSLAEELRKEATTISEAFINKDVQDIVEYIRLQAKQNAKNGLFELRIAFQSKPWNGHALRLATDILRDVDQFKIEYKSEVVDYKSEISITGYTRFNLVKFELIHKDFLYVRW